MSPQKNNDGRLGQNKYIAAKQVSIIAAMKKRSK